MYIYLMIPFSERKIQTIAGLVKAIINTVNCAKSFVRIISSDWMTVPPMSCQWEACNDRYKT